MVPVKKGHLRRGFQPHLVLRVRRQEVKRHDRQVEAPGVSVLPDAGSEGDQAFAGDVGGSLHERLADVVDSALLEAEAVAAGLWFGSFVRWVLDDVLEVVSHEFEDLLEDDGRLVLV